MKTVITELFGVQHPIIQGGMHYSGGFKCGRARYHHRPHAEDA